VPLQSLVVRMFLDTALPHTIRKTRIFHCFLARLAALCGKLSVFEGCQLVTVQGASVQICSGLSFIIAYCVPVLIMWQWTYCLLGIYSIGLFLA